MQGDGPWREGDGLAVEHELLRRQRACRVGDFRNRGSHLVEAAREDAHQIALLVYLDASAIHLPVEHDCHPASVSSASSTSFAVCASIGAIGDIT